MSPRLPSILPGASFLLALLLAARPATLSGQESPRLPGPEDSTLVQVNIRAETRALPESLEISGIRIPGYSPTVVHVFPATGVVIDDRGHVLAFLGYRWVDLGNSELQVDVVAYGGRRVPAKLVGIDQSLGVALVSSPAAGLKRTPLCEPCEVRDGSTVLVPLSERGGAKPLSSARVLSVETSPKGFARGEWVLTVNRPLPGIGEPLLDSGGRVLGFVATQVRASKDMTSSQAAVHPIGQLLNSASKIIRSGGDIRTGWLGVFLDDALQSAGSGVAVNRVEPGSPAEKAGLQAGDTIVRWDSREVRGVREFIRSVQDSSVGSKVAIDALRQGKPIRLSATIEPRRAQGIGGRLFFESQVGGMAQVRRPVTSSGIQMMAITPQLALFFQVPGQGGVLVLGVEPESPYARAGIMAGDVIFAVDSQSVSDPLTLTSYLQTQAGSQRVVLRTVRRGAERRASVEIQPQNAPAPPARKP